jgi:hypothetical protein
MALSMGGGRRASIALSVLDDQYGSMALSTGDGRRASIALSTPEDVIGDKLFLVRY